MIRTAAPVAALLAAATTFAAPLPAAKVKPEFLRVADGDDGNVVALEVATRRLAPPEGEAGPTVDLVGVAHIGDPAFYAALQQRLDAYDVVLYESVQPPGARGPFGETDARRAESTRTALDLLAMLIERHRRDAGAYPASLDALAAALAGTDPLHRDWVRATSTDGWQRAVEYVAVSEPEPAFRLRSLGADGAAGGAGADADIVVEGAPAGADLELARGDGLQGEMARALGLAFQLDAIDYGRDHWRCSDYALDELAAAMEAKGLDIDPLAASLAGEGLPARLIRLVLRLVRFADAFFEGAIADTCKVVLIETLGDESMLEASFQQMGPGFTDVIIGERNQVAVDDFAALRAARDDVEHVAIFYGAAHLPDLEQRLIDQLGYVPQPTARWDRAIEVDLRKSAVSRRDLEQVRRMLRVR